MIDDLSDLPYGLEPVDQRSHALQSAGLALTEGADPELVVAALLHDIGRHRDVVKAHPGQPHEESARLFCDRYFPARVGWLAWAHVPAKRYLVATEAGYFGAFSEGSVASFEHQRGPMSEEEAKEFIQHPWAADAVRLRRWDDLAKVPDGPVPDPADVLAAVAAALAS